MLSIKFCRDFLPSINFYENTTYISHGRDRYMDVKYIKNDVLILYYS